MSERLGRPGDGEWIRELEAERDQLRQQVEKLLGETDELRRCAPAEKGWYSRRLYQAADQVRKELEG